MNLPSPILCSLATNNHILINKNRVYQPSNKGSNTYLIQNNEKLPLEKTETIKNLEKLYRIIFASQIQNFKRNYLEKISGVESKGMKKLEEKIKKDTIKIFYLVEVQNPYLDSLGRENEFKELAKRANEDKKAYVEVLQWLNNTCEDYFILNFPRHTLITGDKIFQLKRKFSKKRETAAVINDTEFFMSREVCNLKDIENKSIEKLEQLIFNEVERESPQILEAIQKIHEFRSAFASGILDKEGFEYQNLGLGYSNGHIVYLRRKNNSTEGVGVYLRNILGKIGFSKKAFYIDIDTNGKITRSSDKNICLRHSNFYFLRFKLKSYPTGIALIKFLHNVRDRCWYGT